MKKLVLICVLCISAIAGNLVEPKVYGSLLINNFNYAYVAKSKSCLELTVKEKMEFLGAYNRGIVIVNGSIIVGDYGDIVDAVEANSNGGFTSYNFATTLAACNVVKDYYNKGSK